MPAKKDAGIRYGKRILQTVIQVQKIVPMRHQILSRAFLTFSATSFETQGVQSLW